MRGRIERRGLLVGAAATLLAGCAGGPARRAETQRKPAEGGIGGTGIVGVVTELGSLVIAGRRVRLGSDTRVEDAFGARPARAIGPGHSLTIEATGGAGPLTAARVRLTRPAIGRVSARSPDGRRLVVAGVAVELEPGLAEGPAVGARVAVSGLWRGETVVASRIDPVAEEGADVVAGEVGAGSSGPTVGGVPLAMSAGEAPPPGPLATVIGRWRARRFHPAGIEVGRFTGAAGPLDRLLVEGYLERVRTAPGYAVSGLGHRFDPAARLEPLAGERALLSGAYTGAFAVETGLVLPESLAARRALLPAETDLRSLPGAVATR